MPAYPAASSYTLPANNYTPRLITVDDSNGCTLTRAAIRAFTRQDFEDQQSKEVGMDRIIAATKEGRMAGVRENTLMDLLLSRHVAMPMGKGAGQGSVIAPFRLVPRQTVVNANYFTIESGAAHAQAGSGGFAASAWQIVVNIGGSAFRSTALKDLEKYFLPGSQILIEYVDSSTNVARSAVYKVVDAINSDSGSTRKATVTIEPLYTAAGWAALSAGDKTILHPTRGTVSRMANSISDYESYGYQLPAVNPYGLLEYWHQTHRWADTYNEEYLKALEAPLTSEWFKKFRTLPLAKQRKQREEGNEQMMMNTFFFGDVLSEVQTVETYTSLPTIYDPADPTCPLEFKANTIGVQAQLNQNGRVSDRGGAVLDLDTIFTSCYNLKRNRETTSGTISVIDAMTDRLTAARIRDIMIKYYKAKFSADVTMYFTPGQKILDGLTKAAVLEYNLYELPDQGVQLAVFTHPYFDDRLAAFDTANKAMGRYFWMIDWSDVAVNIFKTNSARRTTNLADELYRYVLTVAEKQTQLNSKTFEVAVGDTNRHSIIRNFSDGCPNVTVAGCDLAG